MNRFTWPLGIVIVTGMASAFAQPGPPGGSSRGGPAGGPRGGPGSPGGAVPPMPVIEVLDADHNHVISAGELKNATSALLTLDKNRDGQLTENEFGPQAAGAMGRGQARPIGNGRKVGAQRPVNPLGNNSRPNERMTNGPLEGPGGNEQGPPPNPSQMVEHAMEFDMDKDGKLNRDELKKFAEEFASLHPGGPVGQGGPGRDQPNVASPTERARRPD